MRPIKQGPFTPAASDVDGLAANATGATWSLSANGAGDGLAHKITITGGQIADHSAKTAVITGTDADGNAQSETVSLPNGTATVTSVKHYLTVESIVPSATIGADVMNLGWSAVSMGQTLPLEWRSDAAAAMMVEVSGTINTTVQETYANVYTGNPSTLPWVDIAALAASTTTTSGTATAGANAVRLLVNSVTAGATVSLYISQPSGLTL
jgi:hypothetical protein